MSKLAVIRYSAKCYAIRNAAGQLWLGPQEARCNQWGEANKEVPCWLTSSEECALAQAALLEADPAPTVWECVAEELAKEAMAWRESKEDPYNIANAVTCSLDSAARAVLRAIKEECV